MDGGFVAGTLVHTDKGLVPIEQIRVGDLVLSKHENGLWEQAYRRVVNTFGSHELKKVYAIRYVDKIPQEGQWLPNSDNDYETLYLTDNHPVWVERIGKQAAIVLADEQDKEYVDPDLRLEWIRAGDIRTGMRMVLSDGRNGCIVELNERVFGTDISGLYYEQFGFNASYVVDMRYSEVNRYFVADHFDEMLDRDDADRNSIFGDPKKHKVVQEFFEYWHSHRRQKYENGAVSSRIDIPNPVLVDNCVKEGFGANSRNYDRARAHIKVYNIEVEEYHTYYVGELGLWVHD